jgi:hypothetical protein
MTDIDDLKKSQDAALANYLMAKAEAVTAGDEYQRASRRVTEARSDEERCRKAYFDASAKFMEAMGVK